ncbi:MAG: Na+/H+ antiporter subunit E [Steroidobacteraceae bacterium]
MRRTPWLLILGLTVMWLLLNGSASPGQLLLGFAVSVLMTLGFRAVRPLRPHLRRPQAALRLLIRVAADILRSNVAVARIVLGLTGGRDVHSGFVDIPLDLRDPHGLAALAAIVTSTPGTVWADLSPDNRLLTLHVLDLRDPEATRATIKHRYEHLLQEIFE